MSLENQKTFLLENILFQLLDHQSRQGTDHADTMLMLGLVNLFGIVTVMNKQAGTVSTAVPQGRGPGMDPLMMSLLSALGGQRHQGGPEPGAVPGGPGINPAMLMSLLGNQVQNPEQALLLNLLAGMMNKPPAGRPEPSLPSSPAGGWPGVPAASKQAADGYHKASKLENNHDGQSRSSAFGQVPGRPDNPPDQGRVIAEPAKPGQVLKWDPRLV